MSESITSLDKSKLWSNDVIRALRVTGFDSAAADFERCGTASQVQFCSLDVQHSPKVVPHTCHLRICPDCERRESARKLRRYLAPLQALREQNIRGYALRFITITTPYFLGAMTPEKFKEVWLKAEQFLREIFFAVLKRSKKLSPAEKKRGRVSLKKHNIGVLAASEFGGVGQKLHFHFIAYCPFLSKYLIQRKWAELTDYECRVTDVRLVDDSALVGAIQEVSKYVTKFTALPPVLVPRLLTVLKRSRRFRSYGTLFALKVEKPAPCGCKDCGGPIRRAHFMDYLNSCAFQNVPLADDIVNAFDSSPDLNLIHGNKSGVTQTVNTANPDPPPKQLRLIVDKGAARNR